jgi:CubicO group peptidase (beta-lactamase class C family)
MALDEDSDRLRAGVLAVLEQAVSDRVFPGAAAAVVRQGRDDVIVACGRETYDRSAHPVTFDAIFDVASLTKVVATTTAVMQLVEAGELLLQDKACRFIPQLDRSSACEITISQLLTHTAGFRAEKSRIDTAAIGWKCWKRFFPVIWFTSPAPDASTTT